MNERELSGLYPFLHGEAADPGQIDAALLGSIADKARASREASARFFEEQAPVLLGAARALAPGVKRSEKRAPSPRSHCCWSCRWH